MEKERQKLEATAAEHVKLAADLEQVLDWVRENEALVKSRPLLEINIGSIEADLEAHQVGVLMENTNSECLNDLGKGGEENEC